MSLPLLKTSVHKRHITNGPAFVQGFFVAPGVRKFPFLILKTSFFVFPDNEKGNKSITIKILNWL